jgi:glycosyltransferase involved in cell wall biosynthesis
VSHDLEPHGGRIGFVRPLYKGLSYRRSDRIVATCTEVRDGLSEELRVDKSLIDVIPTCIDTKAYENKAFAAREDAILHMGTVGYKNPLATIKAFAKVSSDCMLYITGRVEDHIEDFISSLPTSIGARVVLLGYAPADHLKRLLGTVKIVSVPSQYMVAVASPTVLEAFASGTPVVASKSISRDILRHEENGFVCQPEQEQEMCKRFELLLNDAERWKAMSASASRTAQDFSARRVAERYLELA